MRKLLYILLIINILLLTNCHFTITINDTSEEAAPQLPSTDDFTINLSYLIDTTTNGENHYNWQGAINAAETWKRYAKGFDTIFEYYTAMQLASPQHFGGDTWFWKILSSRFDLIIYATYLPLNQIYYEGFYQQNISPYKKIKFLDGTYYPNSLYGNFDFFSGPEKLNIEWRKTENIINYTYTPDTLTDSVNLEDKLQFKAVSNYMYLFLTANQNQDTATIILNYNSSGAIRYYKFFKDYQWHCWDENLEDCECEDMVED